ncbi:MAG: DUF6159 family protein [Elusimicrobiota bacterium]|jgi:hypothetical protein
MDNEDWQRIVGGAALVVVIGYWIWLRTRREYLDEERGQIGLLCRSFRVFLKDPSTALFCVAAMALAGGPIFGLMSILGRAGTGWRIDAVFFLITWLGYGAAALASGAVVACALKRLRGEEPNIRDGFIAMFEHAPALLAWAALTAALYTGLRALSRRFRALWPWTYGGSAFWQSCNLFVIPVVIAERKGLRAAMARSQALIRADAARSDAALVMSESAGTLILGFLLFSLFAGIGVLMLPAFGWDLWPAVPPMRLAAYAAVWTVGLSFCGAALLADLYLIVLAALYLHAAAAPEQSRAVEKWFPRDLLDTRFPWIAGIARPVQDI